MARKELTFLTDEQVAHIHEVLIARDGGLAGHRHGSSLSAVLERVRNNLRFDPHFRDPKRAAGLTTYSIAVGHPFNDGNKRTALAAGAAVLVVNGEQTLPDTERLPHLIVEAAAHELKMEAFLDTYLALFQ